MTPDATPVAAKTLRSAQSGRMWLLGISPAQARFDKRDFAPCDPSRRTTLETIGVTFIAGYNAAVGRDAPDAVARGLAGVAAPLRGFAAEGAAMGAAVSDALPWRKVRLPEMMRLLDRDFGYLAHVGVGWALASTPWRRRAILSVLDPVHHWLAFDGLGFRDGFFHPARTFGGWRRERWGYAGRAYDQGLGRASWFASGASPTGASALLSRLPEERHGDLFSGLGLAMAYAGAATQADVEQALALAGRYAPSFRQGVAFACEAHLRAGQTPRQAEVAAAALGLTASDLTILVQDERRRLPEADVDIPRYELWRRAVGRALTPDCENRS